MVQFHPMKLINIVANATLEERLTEIAETNALSGYTVLEARGAGSAGLQTGVLEGESNILFMVGVPHDKLDAVLMDVERLIKRGHHLVVFVSETQVMRKEKFTSA